MGRNEAVFSEWKKSEFLDIPHLTLILTFKSHSQLILLTPESVCHFWFIRKKTYFMIVEWSQNVEEWQECPLNGLIWCCLFRRDSTILNHSEGIPIIWGLEWQKWPLNGLICCCLFRRDSTILKHSEGIPVIWGFEWQEWPLYVLICCCLFIYI